MGVFKEKTDEELVLLFKNGEDSEIIGELFRRHALMCFTVCNKYFKNEMLAQDAAMNVFEKLFKDLVKHEIKNFKSWLHSVCRNHCLMELRKTKPVTALDDENVENDTFFMKLDHLMHQESNNQLEKEEQLKKLESALLNLNEKQKTCIELFYLKNKSYEDIEQITGYSLSKVKSYIQNGKRNLKIELSQKGTHLFLIILTWIQ